MQLPAQQHRLEDHLGHHLVRHLELRQAYLRDHLDLHLGMSPSLVSATQADPSEAHLAHLLEDQHMVQRTACTLPRRPHRPRASQDGADHPSDEEE